MVCNLTSKNENVRIANLRYLGTILLGKDEIFPYSHQHTNTVQTGAEKCRSSPCQASQNRDEVKIPSHITRES